MIKIYYSQEKSTARVSQANTFHFLQKPVSQLEIYNTTLKKKTQMFKESFRTVFTTLYFLVTLNDISGKKKERRKLL